mmetsp:Transcript_28857/g.68375  ORF Transcript_28857/g.68375 Transcript_28857/m.68375 type:complete len:294 (-) Transcript_28857:690-1571(-)
MGCSSSCCGDGCTYRTSPSCTLCNVLQPAPEFLHIHRMSDCSANERESTVCFPCTSHIPREIDSGEWCRRALRSTRGRRLPCPYLSTTCIVRTRSFGRVCRWCHCVPGLPHRAGKQHLPSRHHLRSAPSGGLSHRPASSGRCACSPHDKTSLLGASVCNPSNVSEESPGLVLHRRCGPVRSFQHGPGKMSHHLCHSQEKHSKAVSAICHRSLRHRPRHAYRTPCLGFGQSVPPAVDRVLLFHCCCPFCPVGLVSESLGFLAPRCTALETPCVQFHRMNLRTLEAFPHSHRICP